MIHFQTYQFNIHNMNDSIVEFQSKYVSYYNINCIIVSLLISEFKLISAYKCNIQTLKMYHTMIQICTLYDTKNFFMYHCMIENQFI